MHQPWTLYNDSGENVKNFFLGQIARNPRYAVRELRRLTF